MILIPTIPQDLIFLSSNKKTPKFLINGQDRGEKMGYLFLVLTHAKGALFCFGSAPGREEKSKTKSKLKLILQKRKEQKNREKI
ncbi:hypothetical protein E1A91_D06G072700v1 [Gossypium mustelinum]|uniref:Uncharacterized protein n=1 Tax=Gossypium mustelinum TaxID=34275 RepID=A0A5D2UHV2_GOSMU|nr:hypothetical protein E1A91_D06G072700v1 [Gossypium mustelinum]